MMLLNNHSKIILLCAIFLLSSSLTVAEQHDFPKQIQNIKSSFQALKSDPSNIEKWDAYLEFFPATYSKFKYVFDAEDFSRLYTNGHKYISMLNNAPKEKENQIRKILVSVGVGGAQGCCDSWSVFHRTATNYIIKDTKAFSVLIKLLKPKERKNFIKFIADKENHRAFRKYQIIINNLKELKYNKLAKEFETARTLRKKERH